MEPAHFRFWPPHLPRELAYPATGVHRNLAISAARFPERPFLLFYGAVISYRDAWLQCERLAGFLQRHCRVRRGDRVLLYMQNSPQFVLAFYACLRAGAMVVPVNPMHLTNELAHQIEDSGACVALVGQELFPRIAPLIGKTPLANVIVAAYSEYLPDAPAWPMPDPVRAARESIDTAGVTLWRHALAAGLAPAADAIGPDDACVLPYTSGSTGQPKGCVHTHATVTATLVGGTLWEGVTPESVLLATAPMFHVTGMQLSMNRAAYAGAALAILSRWDPDAAALAIERCRCTHWCTVPVMMVDLLSHPQAAARDLSSLRVLSGGGQAMPEAMAQKLFERFGLEFIEGYGMTETMSQTHMNPPQRPKKQCLGIPHFGTESIIIDPDRQRVLPTGELGEIVVRGPSLLKGYWRNERAYRESWVEIDGRSWFRTGDLGRVDDDGYFFIADRLKRMINAAGYKVWPAEVEATMYKHAAIRECCVIATPDERRGETVKAVVALKEGAGSVTGEEIIAWARTQMAAYKVPRKVEFVDALPRGGTGKIQWRALQEKEFERGKP